MGRVVERVCGEILGGGVCYNEGTILSQYFFLHTSHEDNLICRVKKWIEITNFVICIGMRKDVELVPHKGCREISCMGTILSHAFFLYSEHKTNLVCGVKTWKKK